MTLPRCDNCDNWVRENPGACSGQCRALPPVILTAPEPSTGGTTFVSLWPVTMADDGCRRSFVPRDLGADPLVSFPGDDAIDAVIQPRTVAGLMREQVRRG